MQCGDEESGAEDISSFEEEVRRVLTQHRIRRIAEEMSDDGLRERAGDNASGTVCQRIAGDIPVDFVDLGAKERASLSFSDSGMVQFLMEHVETNSERQTVRDKFCDLCGEVRERVWVARVVSGDGWPVLFVCGAEHAVPVRRLFKRVGVHATIICADFDPGGISG